MIHPHRIVQLTLSKTHLKQRKRKWGRINSFYADWPGNGLIDNSNEKYFPSSKLAFYFRKPDAGFPDSSLEYKLSSHDDTAGVWHKSDHLILIPKFDGKGFDTLKSTDGFGLRLTHERILLLNQTNKDLLITMNIKSENGNGTNVLLSLRNHF
jgi:hypothetical protein